jgi:cellulose synthase/poly-beta-1,6-N-acetylglucosamine synthase-like glycosyltransferase
MTIVWWTVGLILAVVWTSRFVDATIGMKRVPDLNDAEWDRSPIAFPRVSLIVPALNEEEHVEQALTGLTNLDYPNYEIIAINDRSTDGTGELMERVARASAARVRIRVVHITELPAGWLGKTHAMWYGAQQASGEFLLFTDADIHFRPDTLRRTMAAVEATEADHFVLLPHLQTGTKGERAMYAFFQLMFVFAHRPWKVHDPETRDSIGLGAFNLIRRSTYEALGTYAALKMAVVDDMMLGEVVKRSGFRQRCAYGHDLIWLHWAHGARGVIKNFTKNFFAAGRYDPVRMTGAGVLAALINLLPYLGIWLAHGWARLPFATTLASMAGLYVGVTRMQRISWLYFFIHPVSTGLFLYAMFRSMFVTLRFGGVLWRGTKYSLEELRRHEREIDEAFPVRKQRATSSN